MSFLKIVAQISQRDLQLTNLNKDLLEGRQALAVRSESAAAKDATINDLERVNKDLMSRLEAAIASAAQAVISCSTTSIE